MYVNRDLYGGAITVKTVPDLVDASNMRQVPDHQEVFMYSKSDISVIVEVLQKVDATQPEEAVKFHFDSLAHDNSAPKSTVSGIAIASRAGNEQTPVPILLQGVQSIQKFNRPALDEVKIYMALFRVESKNIDLVVTFNVPILVQGGNAVSVPDQVAAEEHFRTFAESLSIVNFGLFA